MCASLGEPLRAAKTLSLFILIGIFVTITSCGKAPAIPQAWTVDETRHMPTEGTAAPMATIQITPTLSFRSELLEIRIEPTAPIGADSGQHTRLYLDEKLERPELSVADINGAAIPLKFSGMSQTREGRHYLSYKAATLTHGQVLAAIEVRSSRAPFSFSSLQIDAQTASSSTRPAPRVMPSSPSVHTWTSSKVSNVEIAVFNYTAADSTGIPRKFAVSLSALVMNDRRDSTQAHQELLARRDVLVTAASNFIRQEAVKFAPTDSKSVGPFFGSVMLGVTPIVNDILSHDVDRAIMQVRLVE
jgi:hypothetical protein